MKKLTVGLAILLSGFAANSLAYLPTGTSRCDVTAPSYCGGFTFGLTGLWWRATSPQQEFATSFNDIDLVDFIGLGDAHGHDHDHDYEWGFKANVGYIFPCSGNDVNLTYTHWDNDNDRHLDDLVLPPVTTFTALVDPVLGPVLPLEFDGTDLPTVLPLAALIGSEGFELTGITTAVAAKSEFENHTWDLDFGQAINVGCNFRVRWFGGLRYSQLEHKFDTTFTTNFTGAAGADGVTLVADTLVPLVDEVITGEAVLDTADLDVTIDDIFHTRSKFNGIGPRLGFDLNYCLGGGFGIVGSLSTSLLVGEVEGSFAHRAVVAGTFTGADLGTGLLVGEDAVTLALDPFTAEFASDTGFIGFHHPDQDRVVPNIDAKLGLDWTYQFCNCSRTRLTVEAGYLVSHYFNAIDKLSAFELDDPSFRNRETIDLSFDGPYVSVQVAL